MVLGERSPGRVGRRRFLHLKEPPARGALSRCTLLRMPPRQPPRGRGAPKKPAKPKEREAPKSWGSLARKGVGRMRDDREFKAADAFREAGPPDRSAGEWVRTDV